MALEDIFEKRDELNQKIRDLKDTTLKDLEHKRCLADNQIKESSPIYIQSVLECFREYSRGESDYIQSLNLLERFKGFRFSRKKSNDKVFGLNPIEIQEKVNSAYKTKFKIRDINWGLDYLIKNKIVSERKIVVSRGSIIIDLGFFVPSIILYQLSGEEKYPVLPYELKEPK